MGDPFVVIDPILIVAEHVAVVVIVVIHEQVAGVSVVVEVIREMPHQLFEVIALVYEFSCVVFFTVVLTDVAVLEVFEFFAVVDKGAELVGIEASPFKERSRTLVDEVHGVLVNGDMSSTERSDSCGRSIHADEVNADLAVVLESSGNGESSGEVATERVNQHVHFLAGILGEDIIDIIAVKVGTADEAFQVKIVLSLRHNTFCFATKLPII